MVQKPEILQVGPYPAWDEEALAQQFTIHRLWEAADDKALLASIADRVRIMVAGFGRPVDADLIYALPKLELVASYGVGYDNVDVETAKARGIQVTNTPDVLSDDVADMAIALMLGVARNLAAGDAYTRAGRWASEGAFAFQWPVHHKRLGILGMGRIGLEIAKRADAFGMEIAYTNRNARTDVPYRFEPDKEKLAQWCDYFIIMLTGGPATRHVVDASVIRAIGPTGALINLARGSTLDEEALIEALQTGALGRAALDVFNDEPAIDPRFFALDNVLLSPHQGSATMDTRRAMGQMVRDNVTAHLEGRPLLSPVY